jgi:hypothetical protein
MSQPAAATHGAAAKAAAKAVAKVAAKAAASWAEARTETEAASAAATMLFYGVHCVLSDSRYGPGHGPTNLLSLGLSPWSPTSRFINVGSFYMLRRPTLLASCNERRMGGG